MSKDQPLPEGHYVTCPNGQTLHYLDEGQGPVVVFLHGSGPGASGFSNFKGNYPQWVAAGYRCIVLDLVGFGYSDKPEDVDYTLAFFVECASQALAQLGVTRCALVGNSLGGAVAIGLALDSPTEVEKLILMAPGGLSPREEYLVMPGMQKMFEIYLSETPIDAAALRAMFEFGLVYDPAHITDTLLEERFHVLQLMNQHVMLTMDIPHLAERLGELDCPVLAFWGADDKMMPAGGLLALMENCTNTKTLVLSECGHWAMVEHEALFNRECLAFLEDQVDAAAA